MPLDWGQTLAGMRCHSPAVPQMFTPVPCQNTWLVACAGVAHQLLLGNPGRVASVHYVQPAFHYSGLMTHRGG